MGGQSLVGTKCKDFRGEIPGQSVAQKEGVFSSLVNPGWLVHQNKGSCHPKMMTAPVYIKT
jgi:hypothetical protein